ncbi:MAG TPA: gephyrin-like molybdotransferase Glp [Bacteroidia bacterium]|nr:gephyrin-like molybdotransferase Glp [Bacteroidia bacterium]
MISVEEAKGIITQHVFALEKKTTVPLADGLGCMLAEDVFAPLDLPPFNQSNVDGYAVRGLENKTWKVVGEVKAGDNCKIELKEGEALRIFTGAMVSQGSDCVIMQERITRAGDTIQFTEAELKQGEHIRKAGAQIKKGALALPQGTVVNPAILGFLSGLGLAELVVYAKPKITLIVTGNELQTVGSDLEMGKVYESNSFALQGALQMVGLKVDTLHFVKDEKEKLNACVAKAILDTDLLLISGGISVGDYDFVKEVMESTKTETLFYKVAQKPGKPLYFGKNENCFVFGLPGNPASALTCFYEYVYTTLQIMQGRGEIFLNSIELPTQKSITKKKGLAHFLKAEIKNDGVMPLEGQESFIMKSMAGAGAFIYLPADKENVAEAELVEVHVLPNF